MKFIVTAGGQGTKLWPLSRNSTPKQFQQIVGTKSTFAQNIDLLLKQYKPSDIFVSTKRKYVKHVLEQAPLISFNNLIIEPDHQKNRGPGEGYAFLKLSLVAPNEPFMIIQSDVLRLPEESFLNYIEQIEQVVINERKFVTGGMKAINPEMGSDYLVLGNSVSNKITDKSSNSIEFYQCEKFVERLGDYKETEKLISNFHVVVHVNHFACYPNMILEAYEQFRPDWYKSLMEIKNAIGDPNEEQIINNIYEKMESGPTEEVTKHIFNKNQAVIALTNFEWIDLGTWASVKSYSEKHENSPNLVLSMDSEGNFVKAENGKIVAIYGVDNIIVADTKDALLIINKDKTSKVGEILKELSKKDLDSFA